MYRTCKKVILSELGGYVDPSLIGRLGHHTSHQRGETRHSYRIAKATVEDNIPKVIFRYVVSHDYDPIACSEPYPDLCFLIMVDHRFMTA